MPGGVKEGEGEHEKRCGSAFPSQILLPPPFPPASESIHFESNLITEI